MNVHPLLSSSAKESASRFSTLTVKQADPLSDILTKISMGGCSMHRIHPSHASMYEVISNRIFFQITTLHDQLSWHCGAWILALEFFMIFCV